MNTSSGARHAAIGLTLTVTGNPLLLNGIYQINRVTSISKKYGLDVIWKSKRVRPWSHKIMKNTPFKQGPMSRDDAENISRLYKKKGHEVVIADSLDLDGTYFVYVTLPELKKEPKPSRTFQQRIWE